MILNIEQNEIDILVSYWYPMVDMILHHNLIDI